MAGPRYVDAASAVARFDFWQGERHIYGVASTAKGSSAREGQLLHRTAPLAVSSQACNSPLIGRAAGVESRKMDRRSVTRDDPLFTALLIRFCDIAGNRENRAQRPTK